MSAPPSSRCVTKECRSVCAVGGCPVFGYFQAHFHHLPECSPARVVEVSERKKYLAHPDQIHTVLLNSMPTDRQQQILDFIRSQQQTSGFTPSTREIQRHFGFGSQTAVMDHLRALERKGLIKRASRKARSILLPIPISLDPVIDIPLYGTIPAGMPADHHQESLGTISIGPGTIRLAKGAHVFALKVRGNSMVNAGIHDNDTVILERKDPQDKSIVAALIDGETTLKTYLVRRGRPFLRAENPDYPDLLPANELVIQGVMIALLRLVK